MLEAMTRSGPRPRHPGRPPAGAPRQIRIIGGRWKRSVLPVADLPDLRPTPDRVRETLFNWLGQTLDGLTVLDLFAGTGALGFEAASRGARDVTLVEADARACRHLEATRDRLAAEGIEIVRGDARRWLDRARARGSRYDLILLDPPFGQDWIPGLLARVREVLADGGRVYVEQPTPLVRTRVGREGRVVEEASPDKDDSDRENSDGSAVANDRLTLPGWQIVRAGRAGLVHYHLLVADDAACGRSDRFDPLPDPSPDSLPDPR